MYRYPGIGLSSSDVAFIKSATYECKQKNMILNEITSQIGRDNAINQEVIGFKLLFILQWLGNKLYNLY